jgi:leucyl/phenylalanyl-tRNA--protein transferase
MPVYLLSEDLRFPPPELATDEGLLAVGGDMRPERLVLAYSQGIFPWPMHDMPLLWFSPNPRFVLFLKRAHIGRSLRKTMRRDPYVVRADTRFEDVIDACSRVPRPGQDGTWITAELRRGYCALFEQGLAHSIEAYDADGALVGGLYGVSLGQVFFGESMFAAAPDASKVAFSTLLGHAKRWGFAFIDCQVYTDHLARFGARDIPRARFLRALRAALGHPTRAGRWDLELDPQAALAILDEGG